ncbi:hypothetical protein [Gracilinema caldarium]|uniref:hypothetical protein n=1 Tax=Gracilinema caldarium TaxID=215591 RepID=UPI0026F11A98|nr:hypothetical protein [Gracilinema caldarium]
MNKARKIVCAITFQVVILTGLLACKGETVLQNIISFDTIMPEFIGSKAVSATEIAFEFSVPVNVKSVQFDPPAEIEQIEDGQRVVVKVIHPLPAGERFMADLIVSDSKGNILNVLTPFRARNERLPNMVINEIRTEYSKPKVEFIELYTKSAGNLGAISVITAINGKDKPIYEFPPIEVSQGEYIVLHLRTIEEGAVDELTGDLSRSTCTETSTSARDLWIAGNEERLRKTDGVALLNQDGGILDAVLYSEYTSGEWTKNELVQFCTLLSENSAWQSKDQMQGPILPKDAFGSNVTTTTRTICRDETVADSHSSQDWYITVTSGATPGLPNRTERYADTTLKAVKMVSKNKK